MKNLFEAITKVEEAVKDLSVNDASRVINFVQSGIYQRMEPPTVAMGYQEPLVVEAEVEVEKPAPAPKKKRAPAKKKKDPVVIPTLEEMMDLCRDTANRLGSADKIKELIKLCCDADTIKDANPDTFVDLKKKLEDAK